MLIVPGGYVEYGESPQSAIIREYREETGIDICPKEIIAVRFNMHDWYVVFSADYVSGTAHSDNDENSEVLWLDTDEALTRGDVADLSKKLIRCAKKAQSGLTVIPYKSNPKNGEASLYGLK